MFVPGRLLDLGATDAMTSRVPDVRLVPVERELELHVVITSYIVCALYDTGYPFGAMSMLVCFEAKIASW
ncbi:hypothetical protein GCM10009678_58730 [Actinomadura kijaniata]